MTHRLFAILLSLALVAGCRAPLAETGATDARVEMRIELAAKTASDRRVLVTPGFRSRYFTAEVSGAGYAPTQWLPVAPTDGTTGVFADDASAGNGQNTRSANMAGVVPGGDRRIFKIKIWDDQADALMGNPFLVDEVWGVADMNPGDQNQVVVNPYTTPTAKVFHKLIHVDPGKALTIDINNVQFLINKLTNTDHRPHSVLGFVPINAAMPMISPAVIDVEQVAAAIVRGNNGIPFQVPNPVPPALLLPDAVNPVNVTLNPAAKQSGSVRLKVVDLHGDPTVGRPFLGLVSDPASRPIVHPATAPVDITFAEVAPGSWMVEHTDMERGGKVGKIISVSKGVETPAYTVAMPSAEIVAGTFDADNDRANSYNDEAVPGKLAFLGNPSRFYIKNGKVTFADAHSQRVRRFDLTETNSPVRTIAGSGVRGHRGDGSQATLGRISLGGTGGIVEDRNGVVYFAQDNRYIRALTPSGKLRTLWQASSSATSMWHLGYDAINHHLYVAWRRDSGGWLTGTHYGRVDRVALGSDPENPSVTGTAGNVASCGGDGGMSTAFTVANGYAFGYTTATFSPPSIPRYNMAGGPGGPAGIVGTGYSGSSMGWYGSSGSDGTGDDLPASSSRIGGATSMAVDGNGNLFVGSGNGLYRVTKATVPGATAADWKVKRLLFDGGIRDVAWDTVTSSLYILTTQTFSTPSGAKAVPVIKKVVR